MIYLLWILMFVLMGGLAMMAWVFLVGAFPMFVCVYVSLAFGIAAWLTAEKIDEWERDHG